MSGVEQFLWFAQVVCFFVLVFVASVMDVTARRVPNAYVFAGMAAGLLLGTIRGGIAGFGAAGLWTSFGGACTGFLVFSLPYWLGGLGAGDVKLMTAVGALTSWRFALWAVLYTTIVGALIALGVLLVRGGLREAWHGVFHSSRSERRALVASGDRQRTIPYAVAICLGSLWAVYAYYSRFGGYPW